MHTPEQSQLSLIERIERAMVLFTYFIELDGDVSADVRKIFQAELEFKRRQFDKLLPSILVRPQNYYVRR